MGADKLTVCVMFSILFLGSISAPLQFMQSSNQMSNDQMDSMSSNVQLAFAQGNNAGVKFVQCHNNGPVGCGDRPSTGNSFKTGNANDNEMGFRHSQKWSL